MTNCINCRWLHTFNTRQDEKDRFNGATIGYGCKHPIDGGVYNSEAEIKRQCFKGQGYESSNN